MTGTLGLFSLVDLFQLLAAARRSGRLSIDHPKGTAKVYFDKGQVVHADFAGQRGADAVYSLFADERGTFEFRLGMPATENTISAGTENLVLEAVRRLDEARREPSEGDEGPRHLSVSRDAVPLRTTATDRLLALNRGPAGPGEVETVSLGAPDDAAHLELTPAERRLVEEVDGVRNITRIALQSGIDPDEAALITERLVRTGVLKLSSRRVRTARLVTRLTKLPLAPGVVGIDQTIVSAWEKALETEVTEVACRREDGTVLLASLQLLSGAGPFLELSRDTLVRANLVVNEAVLVRPMRYLEEQ